MTSAVPNHRRKPVGLFSPARLSFGIVTSDLGVNTVNQNFNEYLGTANVQQVPGDPRPAFTLSQGPPSIRYPVQSNGSVSYVGTNYSARNADWFDPHMRMPYVQREPVRHLYVASAGLVQCRAIEATCGAGRANRVLIGQGSWAPNRSKSPTAALHQPADPTAIGVAIPEHAVMDVHPVNVGVLPGQLDFRQQLAVLGIHFVDRAVVRFHTP